MDITFNCSKCGQRIAIDAAGVGLVVACPKCGQSLTVPASSSAPDQPTLITATEQCPYCAETVQREAKKCKHCGSNLERSQLESSSMFDKLRSYILIAAACLSVIAFFMPNAEIAIPILGKMKFSMYDVVASFGRESKQRTTVQERAPRVDTKEMLQSFKISEAGVGGSVCAVAVLGLIIHYLLTVVWCISRFAMRRSFEVLNKIWLGAAIQYPILLTVGASIVVSSMKKEMMANKEENEFAAALGTMFANSFSIAPGLIMWGLFLVAIVGLTMPFLARRLQPTAR